MQKVELEFLDASGNILISVVIAAIDEFEACEQGLGFLELISNAEDFRIVRE